MSKQETDDQWVYPYESEPFPYDKPPMEDQELPITGFDPKGNQFGLRDMQDLFNIEEITEALRPAIEQLRAEIAERESQQQLAGNPEEYEPEQCLVGGHNPPCKRMAETRRLVKEASLLDDRPIPWATTDWVDLHGRRHIAPWPEPQDRRHETLTIDCWCNPTLWKDVIVHWDSPQLHHPLPLQESVTIKHETVTTPH